MTSTGRQWLTFPWWFREALQREWHVIWVFRIIRSSDGGSREDISGFRGMKLRHEAQQQILSNTGLCWALRGRKVAKWWRKWFKAIVLIGLKPAKFFYVMPNVRIPEREEGRLPRQCNSQKGKFITDSSQGSCRIQCSGAGSESPEPKLLPKFIGCA